MDGKYIVAISVLLILMTTAVEVRTWWSDVQEPTARKRAAFVSLLNLVAAGLLIFAQT
ncbi:MAG TPA: hypothetical protein PLV64_21870 [Anaerolineales bacterium]|jgi:hypothetical protein|nr:hypothetical protein [Anaerolineales bacterium]